MLVDYDVDNLNKLRDSKHFDRLHNLFIRLNQVTAVRRTGTSYWFENTKESVRFSDLAEEEINHIDSYFGFK